ncbi:putative RNA polymerase II transcriptional coactivator [Cyphellophora attinorum]|uniref:Putative RNA polymerase II transcriptional coactivator n=1 Tax=Cyphellophora attinorum TaxID=1664694 RepID=A0A0N1NY96_9EURO|nr:putative RNA polymerase II transcriptional coactivator [Phialophora attinorum]KPI36352.1 putative RNA polymerase II transcriptional coactivator [Phialophora attinorum]
MAPSTKRKSEFKSNHFIASDDDSNNDTTTRPSKKGKTAGSDFTPSLAPQVEKNGDTYWEISKLRRVTINEFKGKQMINVREYYEKDGQSLPGKKGISMTIEQYSTLLQILPQIEKTLAEKGVSVPRPDFDGAAPTNAGDEDEDDEGAKNGDHQKANIEATSDEDEAEKR